MNHGCCFKVRNIKLILNCHQKTAAVVAKGLLIRVCEKATLWLDLCKNFPAEFMVLVSPFGSYWIKKKSLFTKSWSYYVANWKIESETTCFEALAQDYIHLLYCLFFLKKTQTTWRSVLKGKEINPYKESGTLEPYAGELGSLGEKEKLFSQPPLNQGRPGQGDHQLLHLVHLRERERGWGDEWGRREREKRSKHKGREQNTNSL